MSSIKDVTDKLPDSFHGPSPTNDVTCGPLPFTSNFPLLQKAEQSQGRNFTRVQSLHIFSNSKYVRLGHFPNRSSAGTSCSNEQAKLSSDKWDKICSIMSNHATMYCAYLTTNEVTRLHFAKKAIGYPSLSGRQVGPSAKHGCSIFISLSFTERAM